MNFVCSFVGEEKKDHDPSESVNLECARHSGIQERLPCKGTSD